MNRILFVYPPDEFLMMRYAPATGISACQPGKCSLPSTNRIDAQINKSPNKLFRSSSLSLPTFFSFAAIAAPINISQNRVIGK